MYALILDIVVVTVSSEITSVNPPLRWMKLTEGHGEVASEMLYDKEEDKFVEARMIYAKNPDTHEDMLHMSLGPIPSTHTYRERLPWQYWDETSNSFVNDEDKADKILAATKANKLNMLKQIYNDNVGKGTPCDALGTLETYRCSQSDQWRMRMASDFETGGGIWLNGRYVHHSQGQAKEVYRTVYLHIDKLTKEYDEASHKVTEATIDTIFSL